MSSAQDRYYERLEKEARAASDAASERRRAAEKRQSDYARANRDLYKNSGSDDPYRGVGLDYSGKG